MANNRLFLFCKRCYEDPETRADAIISIAKTRGMGYYLNAPRDVGVGFLSAFFEKHEICSIEDENVFLLAYESIIYPKASAAPVDTVKTERRLSLLEVVKEHPDSTVGELAAVLNIPPQDARDYLERVPSLAIDADGIIRIA